jgi:hypothetical protein
VSRCNALEHGATARLLALPGEDREQIDKERDAWIASRATDDPIERALLERAFEAWQQLGRTLRAQQGRVEQRMREAEVVEPQRAADAALDLGSRLFCDANGPYQFYPNRPPSSATILTSGIDGPGDPDQPARLILRLESTAAGCRWLLARWNELAEILLAGDCWRSPERFRAVRLLGKQPIDALVDRQVRGIFLACHVLCPGSKSPFADLRREIGDNSVDRYSTLRPVLQQLAIEPDMPRDPDEARQVLTSLVDRATSQIQILLSEHEARDQERSASPADRHAFDVDHEGELMRRYEASSDRSFHRALSQLRLLRKDAQASPVRGMRRMAGETEESNGVILTYKRQEETHEQPLVSQALPTPEPPIVGVGSVAAAPPSLPPPLPPPPGPVDGDREPAAADGAKLRNEAVAASIDRDESAGDSAQYAESGTPNTPNLRNEPVAASIDRNDSAGRAVPPASPVLRSKTPDRRRRGTHPQVKLFANKQRVAGLIEQQCRAPTASEVGR